MPAGDASTWALLAAAGSLIGSLLAFIGLLFRLLIGSKNHEIEAQAKQIDALEAQLRDLRLEYLRLSERTKDRA
jgi:uncharacterized membrane protein YdjX (TVP38/TMEM64 family)